MAEKKLAEEYSFYADNVPAKVRIWKDSSQSVPVYELHVPEISKGTSALMSDILDEMASKVSASVEEVTDIQKINALKIKFMEDAKLLIKKKAPEINAEDTDMLAGYTLHKIYGLGFLDVIMADNWLEEVAINGAKNPITIYHKKYGWCKTTRHLKTEEEIYNLSAQIGRKVGREITVLKPIMDAYLLSGDRAAATLFPISTHGNTITIRRFARNPWTPILLIDDNLKTMSKEISAFLWLAIQYELNILVIGGTASGKTSMLNALGSFMPPTQRIISIEDTREITLPSELDWNWIPLTTRSPNPEGQGEVAMLDLMISALRMRPDRIIVGEIRNREQAETLFEAMHTGHSVYATMHADTVSQAVRRLVEPPIQIPKLEIEALHLVLSQYRDRRKGVRRTLELAEILSTGREEIEINNLYRYRPRNDVFEKTSESVRVVEELNLHTGMTPKEIAEDLKEKEMMLQWMLDNKVDSINSFGKIMSIYYKDKRFLIDAVSKNKKADFVLK